MKTRGIIILVLMLANGLAIESLRAQGFNQKTNQIHINLKQPGGLTVLPSIYWVAPVLEFTNSQQNGIEIEAVVVSEIELKSVEILITNGTSPAGRKSLDFGKTRTQRFKQFIKLQDGQNEITFLVENQQGGKVSSTRSVLVGRNAIADAVSIDRKDYLLIFATDQYDNWNDLVNPIDDSRSIAKVLSERYGFQTEIVENPDQDEVFTKLRDYAERKFKPQDQLMIFFAGHGYFDETFGEGFVVARNSLMNDQAKTSYIAHSRLRQIINNIPCQHIFLAMDVCFGGTFDPVIASHRGMEMGETTETEYIVRKLDQMTRKYLTSGGKEYVSDGIPGKHSPFTLKLLQAFSEGRGSDRILTLTEIRSYVEKLKPEPRFGSFGDDKSTSDFVFIMKSAN
ncbi:MAG: caspase family protein [Cyclobacteriaceae bacterium]|nr:caspase family protein [Cyclobacteriaceae bacterium]